ncbi:MAG: MgtC/SapB family protein [Candidatus Hydrogenedentes bacterium]|nr:MgtC/SapB family protein [Candidatus Hydrogenedentota bacterium]
MEDLLDVCYKFFLAVVLAGAVGLERERHGRAAGLRTHILVCLGSTLAMVVAANLTGQEEPSARRIVMDRVAQGIITGVGFLGAGTIITVGSTHRGLTTAAMVWFAATQGLAIGCGLYKIAVLATAFALFVVIGLKWVEERLLTRETFSILIRMPGGLDRMDEIEQTIANEGFHVFASRLKFTDEGNQVDMTFEVHSKIHHRIENLARELHEKFHEAERIVCER